MLFFPTLAVYFGIKINITKILFTNFHSELINYIFHNFRDFVRKMASYQDDEKSNPSPKKAVQPNVELMKKLFPADFDKIGLNPNFVAFKFKKSGFQEPRNRNGIRKYVVNRKRSHIDQWYLESKIHDLWQRIQMPLGQNSTTVEGIKADIVRNLKLPRTIPRYGTYDLKLIDAVTGEEYKYDGTIIMSGIALYIYIQRYRKSAPSLVDSTVSCIEQRPSPAYKFSVC